VHARTKRAGAQGGEMLPDSGGGGRRHDSFENKKDEAREELRLGF